MSDLIRCDTCRGRKTVYGLGHIEKKCEPCGGIGWITEPVKQAEKVQENVSCETLEKPQKKMGRPKKKVEE